MARRGEALREHILDTAKLAFLESGFERMEFIASPIADAKLPGGRVDMVTALHACDTATDDALEQAVRWRSRVILAIPCCQLRPCS